MLVRWLDLENGLDRRKGQARLGAVGSTLYRARIRPDRRWIFFLSLERDVTAALLRHAIKRKCTPPRSRWAPLPHRIAR
jgi:hypothetical protein